MEISTDDRFEDALRYIGRLVKPSRMGVRGGRRTLKITDETNADTVQMALAEVAVSFMKEYYFQTHLHLPRIKQIHFGAFLRVLTAFDHKTDIIIAATMIKTAPHIFLDSVYDFGICPLQKRWAEVVRLVNESMANLLSKNMFNDFIRFLISNLDHKVSEAHIMQGNKKLVICNGELTPLPTRGNDIIGELIDIAPRTIFIHSCNDNIEKNLIKNIEQIFPNCVTISYANINS